LGALIALIILAQIVPSLGDLLTRAKFLGTGLIVALVLIVFDAILSPTPPSDSARDADLVLPHFADLRDPIRQAFTSGTVELDIAAYSGETFYSVLSEFFQDVLDGRLRVRRLYIRLLLPDCAAPMAVPCDVDTLAEVPSYKNAIEERNRRFIGEFRGYFLQFAQRGIVPDARFEVSLHRLSPLFKTVIINNDVMFIGIYPIAQTPVTLAGVDLQMWDYRGERVHMLGFAASGKAVEREQFVAVRQWFDSVWAHVARLPELGAAHPSEPGR
jgi:hypothetical protein